MKARRHKASSSACLLLVLVGCVPESTLLPDGCVDPSDCDPPTGCAGDSCRAELIAALPAGAAPGSLVVLGDGLFVVVSLDGGSIHRIPKLGGEPAPFVQQLGAISDLEPDEAEGFLYFTLFAESGRILRTRQGPGFEEVTLAQRPSALVVTTTHVVYSDVSNRQLRYALKPQGESVAVPNTTQAGPNHPHALERGPDSRLYWTVPPLGDVNVIDGTTGLGFDVVHDGRGEEPGFGDLEHLAVDDTHVYFAQAGRLWRAPVDASAPAESIAEGLVQPRDILVDARAAYWIDYETGTLRRFDKELGTVANIAEQLQGPGGAAQDDEYVYVSETTADRVSRVAK